MLDLREVVSLSPPWGESELDQLGLPSGDWTHIAIGRLAVGGVVPVVGIQHAGLDGMRHGRGSDRRRGVRGGGRGRGGRGRGGRGGGRRRRCRCLGHDVSEVGTAMRCRAHSAGQVVMGAKAHGSGVAQERRGLEEGGARSRGGVDFIATRERGSEGFPGGGQTQSFPLLPLTPSPPCPRSSPSPLTPAGGFRPDNATQTGTGRLGRAERGPGNHTHSHNQMSKSRNRSSIVMLASSPPGGPPGGGDPTRSHLPSAQGENGASSELQAGCSGLVHHLTFPNAFGV